MPRNLYTLIFMGIVCVICALMVSTAATVLKDRVNNAKVLDIQKKILAVAGLSSKDKWLSDDEAKDLFSKRINFDLYDGFGTLQVAKEGETRLVTPADLEGLPKKIAAIKSAEAGNNSEAAKSLKESLRLPIYHVQSETGEVVMHIIPIAGKGLWSTMFGFLALDANGNGNKVVGITFYKHGETPGLGGEVENPVWQQQWPGKVLDLDSGTPIVVEKPGVIAEKNDHQIDGISGATITSRGVQFLIASDAQTYLPAFRSMGLWQSAKEKQ